MGGQSPNARLRAPARCDSPQLLVALLHDIRRFRQDSLGISGNGSEEYDIERRQPYGD